jgi:hypothetical protein
MGGGKGISTPGFLRARENRGSRRTCDACRSELLSWGAGRPLMTGVVRDARERCGPDVAPWGSSGEPGSVQRLCSLCLCRLGRRVDRGADKEGDPC